MKYLLSLIALSMGAVSAIVVETSTREIEFLHADSGFGPELPVSPPGLQAILTIPLGATTSTIDGCKPFQLALESSNAKTSFAVLLERGGCTFATKVYNAQRAGANAAVIFNNEPTDELVRMGESTKSSIAVNIPSVFISGNMGQLLLKMSSESPTAVFLFQADSMDNQMLRFTRAFRLSPVLLTFAGALFIALGISLCCRLCTRRRFRRTPAPQNDAADSKVVTGVVVTGVPVVDVKDTAAVVIAVPITASAPTEDSLSQPLIGSEISHQ